MGGRKNMGDRVLGALVVVASNLVHNTSPPTDQAVNVRTNVWWLTVMFN